MDSAYSSSTSSSTESLITWPSPYSESSATSGYLSPETVTPSDISDDSSNSYISSSLSSSRTSLSSLSNSTIYSLSQASSTWSLYSSMSNVSSILSLEFNSNDLPEISSPDLSCDKSEDELNNKDDENKK